MKFIIKNCPACRPYDVFGRDNEGYISGAILNSSISELRMTLEVE